MSEYKAIPTADSQLTSLPTNPFLQPSAPTCSCHLPSTSLSCICCCKLHQQTGLGQVPAAAAGSRSASVSSLHRCNYCGWPNMRLLFPLLGQKAASCFILEALPSRAMVFHILDSNGKTQTVQRGHLQTLWLQRTWDKQGGGSFFGLCFLAAE